MKVFIGMFSFPALKAPGVRDCTPDSSVNDNDDVFILVSFISIAILFLVIAFSQINLCQTSSMQESQWKQISPLSARDLQTSNIIFTVGANR